nr:immunoglobulin light chain junction region [Macaca mulatta]
DYHCCSYAGSYTFMF